MIGTTMSLDVRLARERGVNYAVMHSILTDLTKYSREEDGFVPLTADDIFELTALTRRQQDLVIKRMVEDGILVVEKRGIPCRRYFKFTDDGDLE